MSRTDSIFVLRAQTPEEREACFAIRHEVFVEEQKVPVEAELDEHDETALHFLALKGNQSVGAARVIFKNGGLIAKIGRVAVLKKARGLGIGRAVMEAIEADPRVRQAARLILHAQTQVLLFYERLGYQASGDEFMEDGMAHYFMSKDNQKVLPAARAV
jgi:predicted GNAT family N-acyltransferase